MVLSSQRSKGAKNQLNSDTDGGKKAKQRKLLSIDANVGIRRFLHKLKSRIKETFAPLLPGFEVNPAVVDPGVSKLHKVVIYQWYDLPGVRFHRYPILPAVRNFPTNCVPRLKVFFYS